MATHTTTKHKDFGRDLSRKLVVNVVLTIVFIATLAFYLSMPTFPLWLKGFAGVGYTVLSVVYFLKVVNNTTDLAIKKLTDMGLNDKN